ncbi:MAG: N-acetylmuramoyl-L-alanine amidase, partial [Clostridia bacterium]|nr:N-acetylmuramoyl-L-alanine amidase [Clostridia bacterium]
KIKAVLLSDGERIETDDFVLALGHSARDTFELLHAEDYALEQKPFAMGVRIEHPQKMVDEVQYGEAAHKLPAADYRLTYTTSKGRGVYNFCMCHGGRDIGAPGLRPDINPEAERNLSLAFKLKAQLESYGATVVMTRTSNVELSSDARCEFLRQQAPDLCISIHHDSSTRASANGAGFFCFNAFSDKAVKYVYDRTVAGNFYSKTQKSWHYFYLARVTSCPVILTENGFISNQQDFNGIISDSINTQKATAITQGVLDYFNSFYKNVANDGDNSYNDDNSANDQTSSEQPPDVEPNQPLESEPEQPSEVEPEQPQEPETDEDTESQENNNTGDENENK